MRILDLPRTNLAASNLILGLMRITKLDDEEIRTLVGTARDVGITMFDHAANYGGDHVAETRFGDAIAFSPAERERVIIQTKLGIRVDYPAWDFSKENILKSVDRSLAALRLDYLDSVLLHRPDVLVEPEEVAAAFDELEYSGKVRFFGVSNQMPGQIALLKKFVRQPLAFNQVQLSITHSALLAAGTAANMKGLDQSLDRDNEVLDYCRLHDITIQAWSPFQKGFMDGPFIGDRENYPDLNDALEEIAAKYEVTTTAIAVAWITRHPANMQVILGTTSPDRVRESAAGSELRLTRQEWYRLFIAGGGILP